MINYTKHIPYIIIAVLLAAVLYLWNRDAEEVIIPSKTNTFTSSSPTPVIVYDTINVKGETEYIKVPNPVNEELLSKYNNAIDSIEKLKLYKEAVTERKYIERYEDSVQKITVESNVIGTLLNQTVKYETKPITVSFNKPKNRLEAFVGVNLQLPIENPLQATSESLAVGLNFNLLTNKQIFTVGINSNKTLTAGLAIKL